MSLVLAAALMAAYTLACGLDLGLGLLTPLVARPRDRDELVGRFGSPWLGGSLCCIVVLALLIAGLPFSLDVLAVLWPSLAALIAGLGLRAVAVAVRPHVLRRAICDSIYGLASLLVAITQGVALGWAISIARSPSPAIAGGPLQLINVWGLLIAAGLPGAYALFAAGWLILTGREGLRIFGREVGHAAVLLVSGIAVLSLVCVLITMQAGETVQSLWPSAALCALVFAASLLTWRSLWAPRRISALVCAVILVLALLALMSAEAWTRGPLSPFGAPVSGFIGYLDFLLLLGSPFLAAYVLRAGRSLRREEIDHGFEPMSHAGRRPASLANGLHLS